MATPPGWDVETLWQQLVPLWPGLSVEVVPELASTNTTLLQRTTDPAPCLLVAEHQTQGRGRMGRAWHSTPGASLTFSLAVPLAPQRWEGLSLAVGLALAQALDPPPATSVGAAPAGPRLLLKWPNDLWLCDAEPAASETAARPGRKLGGVLVETATRGGQRWVVVGVGLNIQPQAPDPQPAAKGSATPPAPNLSHGYACVQELHPAWAAPQALACVAQPLALALRSFESAGFAPLVAAFATRDLLRGRAVTTSSTPPLYGLAQGVDSDGALLVRGASAVGSPQESIGLNDCSRLGTLHRVHSGEVSVRLLPGASVPAHTPPPALENH